MSLMWQCVGCNLNVFRMRLNTFLKCDFLIQLSKDRLPLTFNTIAHCWVCRGLLRSSSSKHVLTNSFGFPFVFVFNLMPLIRHYIFYIISIKCLSLQISIMSDQIPATSGQELSKDLNDFLLRYSSTKNVSNGVTSVITSLSKKEVEADEVWIRITNYIWTIMYYLYYVFISCVSGHSNSWREHSQIKSDWESQ